CGFAYVDSPMWIRLCGFAYVDSPMWIRLCGFAYVIERTQWPQRCALANHASRATSPLLTQAKTT
ncbi:hypothetical protein, partial [Cronobacter malonaticus]|uniref:hypothetical protein n=1 Tax=Cronobacter malonaticus TaxID=413503 RepID=UPI002895084E